jgi:transcriptional regulator with XRE-family HTH domain
MRELLPSGQVVTLRLLNKMTVSELAELSNLSKAYISQVKHGKRPPSQKLLEALEQHVAQKQRPQQDYYSRFLESREAMGVSPKTLEFYKDRLARFVVEIDYLRASKQQIQHHLNSIPPNQYGLATRHCSYRALKTFYRWLSAEYGIPNPIVGIPAPILSKPILPSLVYGSSKRSPWGTS